MKNIELLLVACIIWSGAILFIAQILEMVLGKVIITKGKNISIVIEIVALYVILNGFKFL